MTVRLDAESESLILRKVASGRYRDEAEVIREALDALEERERVQRLRALVKEGVESAEGGELVELTADLMEELTREAEEMAARGEQPSPDVCP